jgi:TRAF3-interacting protein 1
MGKIGRKKKGEDAKQSEPHTKALRGPGEAAAPAKSYGGFNSNDIEFMKTAIQTLCQSTNPLGKSIDFVTEDIDSMAKEFEKWRNQYASCQSKLEEQQRLTEETIQPLQDKLADIEEKIREASSKINNTKSQIMQNDITISNLLNSVVASRA